MLLSLQTGLLELKLAQRAFLFGLVLFIVASALLQSLFDLLEPHLLALGEYFNSSKLFNLIVRRTASRQSVQQRRIRPLYGIVQGYSE